MAEQGLFPWGAEHPLPAWGGTGDTGAFQTPHHAAVLRREKKKAKNVVKITLVIS